MKPVVWSGEWWAAQIAKVVIAALSGAMAALLVSFSDAPDWAVWSAGVIVSQVGAYR